MRDALHDDLAAAYDDGAVGDFERVADVVVGNQHADAALGKKAYHGFYVGDGDGIDAGKGFVQKQNLRFGCQGACDFRSAPLAARERVGRLFPYAADRKLFYKFFE